jgi:superfamily II DNA or RNA helicase
MITLRPFQETCCEGIDRVYVEHCKRTGIVVMATGGGKTKTAAVWLSRWLAKGHKPALWLMHRQELGVQAAGAMREAGLTVGIEQADLAVSRERLPQVVVASVPTLQRDRLREFPRDAFSIIVVDECHHVCSDSFEAILDYFPDAKVLGLTATPFRSDGEQLSRIFSEVAFEYRIRDAIRDGWLVPVRRRVEAIPGLDLSAVRGVRDFTDEDLAAALGTEPLVREVARRIVLGAGARPTLCFGPTVLYVKRLMAAIDAITTPGRAVALDGTAPDDVRRPVIDGFKARLFQYLGNCALFTEGTDLPLVACVALVRPTKSAGLAEQMIGRALRLCDGKRDALVIEISGRVKPGTRVVGALEVIGAREPTAVRQLAAKMLARDPSLDVSTALDRAARPSQSTSPGRPVAARRDARESLLQFAVRELDGLVLQPPTPGAAPANAMQIAELGKAGIDAPGLDVAQASKLLDGLRWRATEILGEPDRWGRRKVLREKLCSVKQAICLKRFGYAPDCTAKLAGHLMAKMHASPSRPVQLAATTKKGITTTTFQTPPATRSAQLDLIGGRK